MKSEPLVLKNTYLGNAKIARKMRVRQTPVDTDFLQSRMDRIDLT